MADCDQAKTPLWQLEAVSFAYRGKPPALTALDCVLYSGCCTGILGPNGSGKSTLLDLLSGFLQPQTGQILFRGSPLQQQRRRDLAKVLALVPQQFKPGFDFTVRELVAMGLHPHLDRFALPDAKDLQGLDAIMDQCGILAFADRTVSQLSGGEQQRVVVARALAQRPEVLLLDEATASLDVRHTLDLLALLRSKVQAGGLTVVAVLHDLNLAARFCDELIFLSAGRLCATGPVAELLVPEKLRTVYGVDSAIRDDAFVQARQASLRLIRS